MRDAPIAPMAEKKDEPEEEEKGEGSYSAARQYERDLNEFLDSEDAEARARKAQEEVERDEPSYRQAEEEGKRRAAEEDPELYEKGEEKDRID
jgi:hypothetical protein